LAALGLAVLSSVATAQPLQVARMAGGAPCVALTFDDGPDVNLTPRLLATLEEKGVPATFFVLGYRAAAWPDLVAREYRDGNQVGNHSWDHPHLTNLTTDAALRELTRTDDIIAKITGQSPTVTRAPYGSLSEHIAQLSKRTFVAWSVDTLDWRYPNADRIVETAVSKAADGSIILMHDIHPETIVAVPRVIDGLIERGFRLVTVSELLDGTCGGREIGFGKQVPGETAADPFGVEKFQGQVATAASKPAPVKPATGATVHAVRASGPLAANAKSAGSKTPMTVAQQPVLPPWGLPLFRKPTKVP
jgi:peptidoglycan/xylan/chitin deacetylase (PgdA/CDA1 family)